MIFCEPSHPPGGVRKALRCLSLLLLPALLAEGTTAASRLHPVRTSFAEDEPPPPRPPIVRVLLSAPLAPARDDTRSPASSPSNTPTPSSLAADLPAPAKPPLPPPASEAPAASPAKPAPAPILRDDVTPVLHPEDVLPFFKLPGASTGVSAPAAPAEPPMPGPLPPSTARYTQQ